MTDSEQRWIEIRNWDRYQHYTDRRPVWIKLYVELLGNPRYCSLPLSTRGLLAGLLLMTAESEAEIPLDTTWISRRLNGRVTMKQLESLNHAGFITFCASKPLAPRYQVASPPASRIETEKEKERPSRARETHKTGGQTNGSAQRHRIERLIRNGALADPVDLEAELAASDLDDSARAFLRAIVAPLPEAPAVTPGEVQHLIEEES